MTPRVIHLVTSLAAGGLERMVLELARVRIEREPDSTSIVALDAPGAWASKALCPVECVNAHRSRFPWDAAAVSALRGLTGVRARQGRVVVHAHNMAAWQYAALAARRTGTPVVYTQHGLNPHNAGWFDRVRGRFLARRTGYLVAVSDGVRDAMAGRYGVVEEAIAVVPNGVDVVRFKEMPECRKSRRSLGIPEEAVVIGSVGRLSHEKGHDRLIRALASVRAETDMASLRCVLVGDGPARGDLERLVAGMALGDVVLFAGEREDIPQCLSAMNLFVLPSRAEGLPVALLEAMVAGVPAAVTRAGDGHTVLGDGVRGFILPDREEEWGAAVCDALRRERTGSLDEMKSEAKRHVLEKYTIGAVLDAYEDIYRRAVM